MSQNHREGARVSYVGDGADGRVLGERGQILAITGRSGHVKWADGSITLVGLEDVAPLGGTTAARAPAEYDELADSLEVGPVQAVGVQTLGATQGVGAVFAALADAGQFSGLTGAAEEIRAYAEGRVRQDPGVMQAAAQLDPDEGDELVSLAALAILRDASGAADGR